MKTTFTTGLILVVLLALWATCIAPARGQSLTNAPRPPAEMQSLAKALVGKWSTTYEFEPGGMSPTRGTGTGEEVWRPGPGGFVLMEEEHVRGPRGEVFLFALHWWDKSTNSLRGMLCNNSGPAACNVDSYFNSSLKWDGKQLTIDMQFPQNGKKMMWHEVWSITPTSFTQTLQDSDAIPAFHCAASVSLFCVVARGRAGLRCHSNRAELRPSRVLSSVEVLHQHNA